jgi:hypothetical protein
MVTAHAFTSCKLHHVWLGAILRSPRASSLRGTDHVILWRVADSELTYYIVQPWGGQAQIMGNIPRVICKFRLLFSEFSWLRLIPCDQPIDAHGLGLTGRHWAWSKSAMPMYGMELRNKCRATVANAGHNFNKVNWKRKFIIQKSLNQNLGQTTIIFHTAYQDRSTCVNDPWGIEQI